MFMKILTCIAIAVTAGTIASCDEGDEFVAISGTVTDSLTKVPISMAWIANSESTDLVFYTDSLGRYKYTNFPGLRETLYAGKEGYKTKSRYFPEIRGDLSGVNFELVEDTP